MFYFFMKSWVSVAMFFFYRRIVFSSTEEMGEKGPLMIASPHPDSFLDALYFAARMRNNLHVITRGDVFAKPKIRKLLTKIKLIPIFRIRDGKEKLNMNNETADGVVEVLRKDGMVMIFVEGFCNYQTELQLPLKKGAPRMTLECWKQDIDVRILPVWIRYDSFSDFGKILTVNFGKPFGREIIDGITNEAAQILEINKRTERDLLQLSAVTLPYKPLPFFVRWLLFPFAMLAKLVHAPLYYPAKNFVKKKTAGTTHYDSVILGLLVFTYPVYLLLISLILWLATGCGYAWLTILAFPLLAKLYLYWKK